MHVHVVNLSTLVSDDAARLMVQAVNVQVRGDFARAWDRERDSVHFSSAKDLQGCSEHVIAIVNAPPVGSEGAYGEHVDLGDQVVGYVYASAVIDAGGGILEVPPAAPRGCCVSAVLSHEVLELLGNPHLNRWCDDELGDAVAMELCDPCEADVYELQLSSDGKLTRVMVSNFVLPSYFDPRSEGPFDFMGCIKAPFALAALGYQIVRDGTTNQRAVFGVVSEWKARGKACALSRTSQLCAKPKVVAVLDAVRALHESIDSKPEESKAPMKTEPSPAPVVAAPPAPKKKIRRVIVGPGGRGSLKPKRRVKVG